MKDSAGNDRPAAPLILFGSGKAFTAMSSITAEGPSYMSTTLSGTGHPEVDKVRYVASLYSHHYLAGIQPRQVGQLAVLHPSESDWDAHILLARRVAGVEKKVAFIRPKQDFLRFAWLGCLVNRLFKWDDPLDPQRYRPIHFKRTWASKPEGIVQIDRLIAQLFRTKEVKSRADIITLLEGENVSPDKTRNTISITVEGKLFVLEGYAATEAADDPDKLKAHFDRTTKPFLDVESDQEAVGQKVQDAYDRAVAQNSAIYGIKTKPTQTEFVIPNYEEYRKQFEDVRGKSHQSSASTEEVDRADSAGLAEGTEAIHLSGFGSRSSGGKSHQPDRRSREALGGDGNLPAGRAIEDPGASRRRPDDGWKTGDGTGRTQSRDHRTSANESDAEGLLREAQRWRDLILMLLRFPRWFRKKKAAQRSRKAAVLDRNRRIQLTSPKAYLLQLRKRPLQLPAPHETAQPLPRITPTAKSHEPTIQDI